MVAINNKDRYSLEIKNDTKKLYVYRSIVNKLLYYIINRENRQSM